MKPVLLSTVLAGLLLTSACLRYDRILEEQRSPDHSMLIRVIDYDRFPLPRQRITVELFKAGQSHVIEQSEYKEVDPCFVHVAWTADSHRFIVLFRDCWRYSRFLAYDVEGAMLIEAGDVMDVLAQSIRATYRLPEGTEPIEWATKSDASRRAYSPKRAR